MLEKDLRIGLSRSSLLIGRKRNFFYGVKQYNKPFFDHLVDLSTVSLVDGYDTYLEETEKVTDLFLPLFNILEENRKVNTFSKYYGCSQNKLRVIADSIGGRSMMVYGRYVFIQRVIPVMEKFIKDEL